VRARRILLQALAPLSAIIVSLAITSVALLAIGKNPITAFHLMFDYGRKTDSLVSIVNRAVPLYLSAIAVAIGFKMNLFNIGVEGQYTLAALIAAAVGAALHLPPPIHITLILLTGMAVGAFWAGIAGLLKVTRGVSEVISTIMLNYIAFGVVAYLLSNYLKKPLSPSDLTTRTRDIPASGLFPSLNRIFNLKNPAEDLSGVLIVAVIVGVLFYVLVWRTRFGYNLRASGVNPDAARASGVDPGAMILKTMLLSGGVAGLVGMLYLLSFFKAYSLDFPTGLGFAGIAVALVGRNNPVGIAVGALLFGFLERSAQILDLNNIPKEMFLIMEGIIILTVVIAYEVVSRIIEAQETRAAAEKAKALTQEPAAVSA
jgi:simple sugar transport system permease protein